MRETVTQLQMVTIAHASKDSKDPTAIVSKHVIVATFASYIEKEGATYAQQNKYFLAGISKKKKHSREPSPRKSTEGSTLLPASSEIAFNFELFQKRRTIRSSENQTSGSRTPILLMTLTLTM